MLERALEGSQPSSTKRSDRENRMDPNAQFQVPAAPAAPAAPAGPSMMSKLLRILGPILVVVVIAVGAVAFRTLTAGPAKIVFTTTNPSSASTCDEVKDLVDSVSAGTDVWMVINFKSTMDDSTIYVTVTKDGEDFGSFHYDDASGVGCVSEETSLSGLEPGTYKFTAKKGDSDSVEAEGTLTVK
jgi:hypothetical protein